MKKYLIYAGMFLGSFLVINVGMYFLLNMTQSEVSHELTDAVDSTAVHGDSLLAAIPDTTISTPDSSEVVSSQEADTSQETITESDEDNHLVTLPPVITEGNPETAYDSIADSSLDSIQPITETLQTVNEGTQDEIQVALNQPEEQTQEQTQTIVEEHNPAPVLAPNPKEIAKLAKLLEGMKPAEAAAIASRLDVEEIVMLVMKMKDRKAAKMMAELPIDTAAEVAQRMSELVEQRGIKS